MKKTTSRKAAPSKSIAEQRSASATMAKIIAQTKPSKGEATAMSRVKARTFKTEDQAERAAQDAHVIPAMFGLRVARLPDGKFGYVADTDEAEAVKQIDEAPPPDDGISFDVEPPSKPAPLAKSQRTDPAVTKLPARVAQGGGSKQRAAKPADVLPLAPPPEPSPPATPPPAPSIYDPIKGRTTGNTVFVIEFESPDADARAYVIEALRNLGSGWRIRVLEAGCVDREKQLLTQTWAEWNAAKTAARSAGKTPDGEPRKPRPARASGEMNPLMAKAAEMAQRKEGVTRDQLKAVSPKQQPWTMIIKQAAERLGLKYWTTDAPPGAGSRTIYHLG